ncbi:hypothetical protein Shyhy01_71200 [Streptomyces hygroscopicus subsp. hygroscopicus]|nr:hypothetical protein Shyhy01_71200 [Streptomyces hygroscopicus subsp. hygroscopicus]
MRAGPGPAGEALPTTADGARRSARVSPETHWAPSSMACTAGRDAAGREGPGRARVPEGRAERRAAFPAGRASRGPVRQRDRRAVPHASDIRDGAARSVGAAGRAPPRRLGPG